MVDKRKYTPGVNGLVPPARLSPAEMKLWNDHIKNAEALRPEHTMAAFTWVRLSAAYAANPDSTSMAAIRHMNQIGWKLGFGAIQKKLGVRARALRSLAVEPVQPKKRFKFDYFNDPDWKPPTNGRA